MLLMMMMTLMTMTMLELTHNALNEVDLSEACTEDVLVVLSTSLVELVAGLGREDGEEEHVGLEDEVLPDVELRGEGGGQEPAAHGELPHLVDGRVEELGHSTLERRV